MSEHMKIPNIVFVNTLHDNPSAQYPKFLREAKQIAFRLMTEFVGYPAGLMQLVIPIAEYNLIPQVTILGVLQPPIIDPLYPADPGPAATPTELELYRQSCRMNILHYQCVESFKSSVLVAMGPDLVQEIADPLAGEAVTMPTLQIFQHLAATHGVLTAADVRELKLELEQPISSDDMKTFVKFAANFSTIVLRLQTAGQALPAFEQMELFSSSTSHEPNIVKAIEKYVDNHPVLAARALPQMIAAVRTSLSNMSVASKSAYAAQATNVTMELAAVKAKFADLEVRFAAAMQSQQQATTAVISAPKRPAGKGSRVLVPAYCYVHGHCFHPGSECTVMLANRSKFTNAMRKAKSPTDVVGGSTKG